MEDDPIVKALRDLATGHGVADPAHRAAIQPFLAEAGRGSDEADGVALVRLVGGLPDAVSDRNRAIYLAAANVENSPVNRQGRLGRVWSEQPGWEIRDRQVKRVIESTARALKATYCAPPTPDPMPGRPLQEHYFDAMDVYIEVPSAGRIARCVSEMMEVSPRHDEMHYWRGQRTVIDKNPPTYSHLGAGSFAHPEVGSGGVIVLRIDFDPPARGPQKFAIVSTYAAEASSLAETEYSFYGLPLHGRPPKRFSVEVQFGRAPVAVFWVQSPLSGNFPLRPDYCESIDLVRGTEHRAIAPVTKLQDLENMISGVVWFWVEPQAAGFVRPK